VFTNPLDDLVGNASVCPAPRDARLGKSAERALYGQMKKAFVNAEKLAATNPPWKPDRCPVREAHDWALPGDTTPDARPGNVSCGLIGRCFGNQLGPVSARAQRLRSAQPRANGYVGSSAKNSKKPIKTVVQLLAGNEKGFGMSTLGGN